MSQLVKRDQRMAKISQYLEKPEVQHRIAEMLPANIDLKRMTKVALSAATRNFRLLDCTPQSWFIAMMNAAELGLEAGSLVGSAHLVPLKNKYLTRNNGYDTYEVHLWPDYRGLIDLARRSGYLDHIEAVVVHEKDEFRYVRGLSPTLEHTPHVKSDPGHMIGVYAIVVAKDTDKPYIEFMRRDEIDKIKNRSRASSDGPWVTDYERMALKTVIKRVLNLLPKTPHMANAITLDNALESGDGATSLHGIDAPDVFVEEPVAAQTQTGQLAQQLQNMVPQSPPMQNYNLNPNMVPQTPAQPIPPMPQQQAHQQQMPPDPVVTDPPPQTEEFDVEANLEMKASARKVRNIHTRLKEVFGDKPWSQVKEWILAHKCVIPPEDVTDIARAKSEYTDKAHLRLNNKLNKMFPPDTADENPPSQEATQGEPIDIEKLRGLWSRATQALGCVVTSESPQEDINAAIVKVKQWSREVCGKEIPKSNEMGDTDFGKGDADILDEWLIAKEKE